MPLGSGLRKALILSLVSPNNGGDFADFIDGLETQILEANVPGAEFVFINEKADFPDPSGGVITLAASTTYVITTEIDLLGDRLVCGQDTTIIGTSPEVSGLSSTGLTGTALITSVYTMPMRFIHIHADVALDLDGQGAATAFLVWTEVNFIDCGTIGTIKNYENTIIDRSQFLNNGALTFDGTHATIAFTGSLVVPKTGATGIILPATATVSRRFRSSYGAFVTVGAGDTALNVHADAIANPEAFILDTMNFTGAGTSLGGIEHESLKTLFTNNVGITNSSSVANYFMNGNATATDNSSVAIGVPVKVAGTTTSGPLVEKFTQLTDNKAIYVGALTGHYMVMVSAALTAGNGQQLSICIAKNGTPITASAMTVTANAAGRAESVATFAVVEMSTTDFIEIAVANETIAVDITVTDMQVVAQRIS